MDFSNKATRINLKDFHSPQMRAFHMTWFAFFLCFFAWFGMAPLMPTIRKELSLEPWQVGNLIIASVSATILARLAIGWLCDRFGPRLTYTGLLCLGSLPVMSVGFVHSYESLFWLRLGIGVIGASFVITQYHTSIMFAPNCVGAANATAAGWGNLGGGVTQQVMPLLASLLVWLGVSATWGWRLAVMISGVVCLLTGVAYFLFTQDAPEGNFSQLRAQGKMPEAKKSRGGFLLACRDRRVWALFVVYGACFGLELTIDNIAATYFFDQFQLSAMMAGMIAGLFGMMNLFARALGGLFSDRFAARWGLRGRVNWLFVTVFCEGIGLILFSQMRTFGLAIAAMILFAVFLKMANGATYAVVPFINKKALGSVAGIVGAGGNVGAMSAGFLFKTPTTWWPTALLILGGAVTMSAFAALTIRFPSESPAPLAEPATVEATHGHEPALVGSKV